MNTILVQLINDNLTNGKSFNNVEAKIRHNKDLSSYLNEKYPDLPLREQT